MEAQEALARNKVMDEFYSGIPSYAQWREEHMDAPNSDRLIWWTDMRQTVDKEKSKLSTELSASINYWIAVLSPVRRDSLEEEEVSEYCSKRQPWHLGCDI